MNHERDHRSPAEGDEIDGYRVLGARAGQGYEEYNALDLEFDRRVVLRFIAQHRATPSDLARVRREAKTLVQLAHPNIVPSYALGVYQGRLFIVMAHIEATRLDIYLDQRAPSWRSIVPVFTEAGRGLAAAHARAIVHRNMRAQAIVISVDGRARLGDFGLGFSLWPALSSPDQAPLEALYTMAPEQFHGRPATIYGDQFAFCVALWQSLSGRHPLATNSRESLIAALSGARGPARPAMPRRLRGLWRVVERGLNFNPPDRYGSMHELVAALERATRPLWRSLWPGRPGA